MSIEIPDALYFAIMGDIQKAYLEQSKAFKEVIFKKVLTRSEEYHIDSDAIVNFVSTACADTYFAALKASEEVLKLVLVSICGIMVEELIDSGVDVSKLPFAPPEIDDTLMQE